MKRFWRAAIAKWWIVVLAGLLGLAGGTFAARQQNSSIVPVFNARATLPVEAPATGPRAERTGNNPLTLALKRANEINAELLAQGNAIITTDLDESAIVFSGRSQQRDLAVALAEDLRDNYLLSEFGAISVDDRMELLLTEAIEVQSALDALEPPAQEVETSELDPTSQARMDFLVLQAGALANEASRLVGDLVLAETGETRNGSVEEIQTQINSVQQKLEDTYVELETLPGYDSSMLEREGQQGGATGAQAPGANAQTGTSPGDRTGISVPANSDEIAPGWQKSALEDRYLQLQTDYESLFVESLTGQSSGLEPATVQEVTPSAMPVSVAAGVGFGGGLLLALIGLWLAFKLRRPLWAEADLAPLPVVAEMPIAVVSSDGHRGRDARARRSDAIQRLRGSVVRLMASQASPMVIGLNGFKTERSVLSQLATELAVGVAAADRTVVVLDLDFELPSPHSEEGTDTVAGLLALFRVDVEGAASELKRVLSESTDPARRVRRLMAGVMHGDPTDALLSKAFDRLLDDILSQADLIITVIPGADRPAMADALFRRVDAVVGVCRMGKSRETDLVALGDRLEDQSAQLVGAVLLMGRPPRQTYRSGSPRPTKETKARSRDVPRPRRPRFAGKSKLSVQDPLKRGAVGPVAKSPRFQSDLLTKVGIQPRVASSRWQALPSVENPRINGSLSPSNVEDRLQAGALSPVAKTLKFSSDLLEKVRLQPRVATSRWRALPDFMVIGAQRSGTTSLYDVLSQHPSIVPSIRRETEFLTSRHSEGERWYRAHFPIQRENASGNGGRQVTFEADPSYLLDPRAPLRASLLVPDAKIIVLLRDPVARAISHYNHNLKVGQEELSLGEALDLEPDRLKGEVERMSRDPDYPAEAFLRYSYATRGRYAEQLERWLEFYPADRVRVVHSEDFFRDASDVFLWLLDFLELPPWQPSTFAHVNYTSNGHVNGNKDGVAAPEIVARLRAEFAPHNERLYDLIEQDFGW